jgi:uncharacterized protein YecT (DUF1311 family)
MKIAYLLVVAALGATSLHAIAQTPQARSASKVDADGIRASYSTCLDASGGVTPAMQTCFDTEYVYQDKRLNSAYKSLMAGLDPEARNKLRHEERNWLTHRRTLCAIDPDSGQSGRINSNGCELTETAKRATALEMRRK